MQYEKSSQAEQNRDVKTKSRLCSAENLHSFPGVQQDFLNKTHAALIGAKTDVLMIKNPF
jgi:hypothetical protein